jgi:hypothetical protein
MNIRNLLLPGALLAFASGCDSTLNVQPSEEVSDENAIVDAVSARSALAGAYDALQDVSPNTYYYSEGIITMNELSSDNADHSGTFTSYVEADDNLLTAANDHAEGYWEAVYRGINRANVLIQKIPSVGGLSPAEKDQIVGEALFLRALHYHNLVKIYGGVPIRLTPVATVDEASTVARVTVAEVYTQILADLAEAEALLSSEDDTRIASHGSVRALRARVLLYRASPGPTGVDNGDWTAVEAAATSVINMGYVLAGEYSDLFSPTGGDTPEDIFRVRFTDQDANSIGYYFTVKSIGGRYEVAPSASIRNAYEADDERLAWSISSDPVRATRFYVSKYPTVAGTEHPHVIRLAEIYLARAEARAMLNDLVGAVSDYNLIRARAGLAPHVLGVDVAATQAAVLDAVRKERRLELAFEGDRWPDLVRSNLAVSVMGLDDRPGQVLYPIPQSERDVTSPPLQQNPGY